MLQNQWLMFSSQELFNNALLIDLPLLIDRMKFDQAQGKLDIWIDFARSAEFPY